MSPTPIAVTTRALTGPVSPGAAHPCLARAASSRTSVRTASPAPSLGLFNSTRAGAPNRRPCPLARTPAPSATIDNAPCSKRSLPANFSIERLVACALTRRETESLPASFDRRRSMFSRASICPFAIPGSSGMPPNAFKASRDINSPTASIEPTTRNAMLAGADLIEKSGTSKRPSDTVRRPRGPKSRNPSRAAKRAERPVTSPPPETPASGGAPSR